MKMLSTTEIIKTKSFKLAIYKKGSENANKLVLVLPGRLDTKDYAHMRSHVDLLSKKGYLALSFDPPGTWESKGDLSIYTTTNYLKAIKEVIEYYGNKPTFVLGHSRGGTVAMLAAVRFDQIKIFASILGRATRSTEETNTAKEEDWKKKGYRIQTRDTPDGYEEKIKTIKLPYSYNADAKKYEQIEDLKKCTKPKLFIAGSKDTLVDPLKIKEAYELSSEPKQFVMLETDHDYRKDPKMIEKVNEIICKFISDNKK